MINLHGLLLLLRQRIWVASGALVLTVLTTTVVTLLLPKSYTAVMSLVLDVKSAEVSPSGQPVYLQPGYLQTQSQIISSHKVAVRVVQDLKLADNPIVRESFESETGGKGQIEDWLADRLLQTLEVKTSKSNIVDIEFRGSDPAFAAAIANAFGAAYIDVNLELLVEPARHASTWFQQQLGQLRTRLEEARLKLTRYQQEHGIASPSEQTDVESARHSALSSQLVQAQADTYDALSKQKQAQEFIVRGGSLESLPEVLSNGFIQKLKSDLVAQESKLFEFENSYGKNHPRYQRQQADVEELRQKLNIEIRKVMQGIDNAYRLRVQREAEIRAALSSQKSKVLGMKSQHDELAVLMRDVDGAQQAYDEAVRRYSQTNLESQTSKTNVAVLNPAVPPIKASRPKLSKNIAISVALGLMLGVGGVLLIEVFDRRIRSALDVTQDIGLPLLARLDGRPKKPRRWPKWPWWRAFGDAPA